MDPGPGTYMLSPTGFRDAFIIKLDKNAQFIWAKQFGGPGDTGPQAGSLEIDINNNVIIAGSFNNTVDFDPGPGIYNLSSAAHFQAFIVKLSSNGELIWVKQFGNSSVSNFGSSIRDLKSDALGNIYVTGSFSGTVDFDPDNGVYNATSSGGSLTNGFICKLSAGCNFVWIKTIGQVAPSTYNGYITPMGIDIDKMNNILICGYFIGNFDFDPGPAVQNEYKNPGESFILKLDPLGNLIWVKTIGSGTEPDTANDVMADAQNNVCLIGSFGTSVDFDPGPGVHIINSPHYGAEAVVMLKPDGSFSFVALVQSIYYGSGLFRQMALDSNRNIYVTGSVSGTMDFDPGPGVFPLSGPMDAAPFVLKLSKCVNATRSTLTVASCDSYSLNNQTFDSSGVYEQTIPNASGCDSIITLYLTINKKLTEQTISICNGDSYFAGGANQTVPGIFYDTLQTVLGCDSVVKTSLTVNPRPSPNLGADRSLCRNATQSPTLTPGIFESYIWQDNSTGASLTVDNPGKYWVQVSNEYNCSATDTLYVMAVVNTPSGFLKETDSVCKYRSLELVSTQPFTSYLWSTGAVQKNIQVKDPGLYRLTVTDINGCAGVDSIVVFEKQCMAGVFIPTAFTPNKDGKNDIFKPVVFGKMARFRLEIYNRWGQLIFQSSDPEKGWDGSTSGLLYDTGVFVWVCTYQLEGTNQKTEKGTVLLIR